MLFFFGGGILFVLSFLGFSFFFFCRVFCLFVCLFAGLCYFGLRVLRFTKVFKLSCFSFFFEGFCLAVLGFFQYVFLDGLFFWEAFG